MSNKMANYISGNASFEEDTNMNVEKSKANLSMWKPARRMRSHVLQ